MSGSLLRGSCALLVVASLTACSGKGGDPMRQYGPNPYLPEPRQYLIPPMSVPKAVGWKSGETPSVPAGLRIQAMATGLMHPRIVYPLSKRRLLVVESNSPGTKPFRPKDYVQGKVKARAGAGAKGGNRITLLRDADGDGVPELKTVLVDHLHSPYGIALVGGTLYVANTDAIIAFPFTPGQTNAAPGVRLTDLPAGPIDHHWTKAMVANPDGSKLYVGVGSNSNITENGMDAEQGRAAIYEVDRLTGAKRIYATGTRNPTNLAIQPGTGQLFAVVNERDEIGPDLVPDYLIVDQGRRLLWLALQLLGTARGCPRPPARPRDWSRRPSNRTTNSALTWRLSGWRSATDQSFRHGSPTAHSWASTEAGIETP